MVGSQAGVGHVQRSHDAQLAHLVDVAAVPQITHAVDGRLTAPAMKFSSTTVNLAPCPSCARGSRYLVDRTDRREHSIFRMEYDKFERNDSDQNNDEQIEQISKPWLARALIP